MDIKHIVAQAAYIEERISQEYVVTAENERSEEKLQSWKKLLNVVPDKRIFEERLSYGGITEADARKICGDVSIHENVKLPYWAEILTASTAVLPAEKEQLWETVSIKKEDGDLTGPIAALLPFLVYAEKRFAEKYRDIPLKDLSDILLKRLYYLCSQTFNARARRMLFLGQGAAGESGQLWGKLEDKLLSGEWIDLLEAYPVLAKRVGITVEYFIRFTEEFLDRFFEKKEILAGHFFHGIPINRIEQIQGEISDLHQKGKSVLIINIDGGRKLVYKPRPMDIDTAWEEFLTRFRTAKSSIRAPRCVDFGTFGFIEYIENEPCGEEEDIKTYFYNAGALMALLYAFGGNDFHMENIVASGRVPVIVDTETLMTPVARFFGKGGRDVPEDAKDKETLEKIIEQSVMTMGFLPVWRKDGDDKRTDYGALTGDKSDMKNLPVYGGEKYAGNGFPAEIAGGFRDMYRHIMARQEELLRGENGIRLFDRCKFRMLLRNSQVYGNVLQHITQPSLLKNGFDYSMTTDRMVNAFLYDAHESIKGQLINVFLSEKTAVERGDIPIFYGEPGGEGILDEEGMLFAHYFEKSAIGNARERISNLSEDDMQIQLQIIDKSLATEARNVHEYLTAAEDKGSAYEERRPLDREELLAEARAIYAEIMENRFVAKNGDYSWLAEQYDLSRSGTSLSVMGPSLYDGLLGISVFSSALYSLTKEREPYETAMRCMKKAAEYLEAMMPNMERYQMNLGYSSGIAGYITGLSLTSGFLGAEEGYKTAEKLIRGITQKMVRADTVCDVLGGVSGLVLALTREERWRKEADISSRALELLKWCGEHLLEERSLTTKEGYRIWKSKEASQTLTGLGHGASGMAAALFRLYEIFGDEKYLEAGKEAVAYENSVYDAEAGNWPDFRNDPSEKDRTGNRFMGGYCSGAPGIGLARLDGLKNIRKAADMEELAGTLTADIRRADRFIHSAQNEGRNHLCCGSAGRIDFLIEEGFRFGDASALELAHRKLSGLILGKQKRGHYNFHTVNGRYYYNPTLFQGTAGVGYEILRFLDPAKIKSLLI